MSNLVFNNRAYDYSKINQTDIEETNITQLKTALQFLKDWQGSFNFLNLKTSGSTGTPKEISFSKEQITLSATTTINAFNLTPNDVFLVCLNTQFVAGMLMLARAVMLNAKIVLVEPIANPLLDLEELPISFAAFVPLQVEEILKNPASVQTLKNIKQVIIGGASLNNNLEHSIALTKPKGAFHTYGMTETLTHVAIREIGSEKAFKTLPGATIKLNEEGCLCIKNKITQNNWITTTDLAEIIDDNSFIILGRADFIINSGGYKINPFKIEQAISELFKNEVKNVSYFVGSIKDDILNHKCVLFIEKQINEEIDLKKLGSVLHKYEIPKQIIFLKSFIYGQTGKLDRIKTLQLADIQGDN
jgi:o-succinylbenzoate---CoA ligase